MKEALSEERLRAGGCRVELPRVNHPVQSQQLPPKEEIEVVGEEGERERHVVARPFSRPVAICGLAVCGRHGAASHDSRGGTPLRRSGPRLRLPTHNLSTVTTVRLTHLPPGASSCPPTPHTCSNEARREARACEARPDVNTRRGDVSISYQKSRERVRGGARRRETR